MPTCSLLYIYKISWRMYSFCKKSDRDLGQTLASHLRLPQLPLGQTFSLQFPLSYVTYWLNTSPTPASTLALLLLRLLPRPIQTLGSSQRLPHRPLYLELSWHLAPSLSPLDPKQDHGSCWPSLACAPSLSYQDLDIISLSSLFSSFGLSFKNVFCFCITQGKTLQAQPHHSFSLCPLPPHSIIVLLL